MRRFGCLVALALLSACSMTPTGASPSPQVSRFATTGPMPSVSAPSGVPASPSAAQLDAIRSDLRARGVTGAMTVVSSESVTFSDGSLGCPLPGVSYTQAQVQGMRVVVEADGRTYDYRFGRGDAPRLCEQPQPGPASTSTR